MGKDKNKLFDDDDSEEEVNIKTENEYAKKYDVWRGKEEMHKLEQKYGSKVLTTDASLSSDSEDESDEPPEESEEMEKQFLKTLALLKTKDPRIYDPKYQFFENGEIKPQDSDIKKKEVKFEDSDDSSDEDGNIFKIEKKASEILPMDNKDAKKEKKNSESQESNIKDFLTGKAEHIDDPVEKDLEPLRALWSNPNLNEGEAFLRDYILNKRYLEAGGADDVEGLRDDEELEQDQATVEEQGSFERAYNFRFEEPDDEYLKRYPRTMAAVRPKDERRASKRAELRTRKQLDKQRKMDEIARLKALKLKEIQEKMEKIKEVTGNKELAFREEDLESDFDPTEHDRRMAEMFDDHYYENPDDKKPEFPDIDEDLEIENWEKYDTEEAEKYQQAGELHCEDDDFNMDADYDPKKARNNLMEEIQETLGKKRRNRRKKSKLAEVLDKNKPKYVPTENKTYSEYMEEYYKMDCEDVIAGEIPTRFKYRQVVPNDFGLTVEEILLADDRELTQWVPIKKIVKHRADDVERSDVTTYRNKASDVNLKKKILPSLFKELPEEPDIVVPVQDGGKKKKKKKKTKQNTSTSEELYTEVTNDNENNGVTEIENVEVDNEIEINNDKRNKKKNKKRKISLTFEVEDLNQDKNDEPEDSSKETKHNKEQNEVSNANDTENKVTPSKKPDTKGFVVENVNDKEIAPTGTISKKKKRKKNKPAIDAKIEQSVNNKPKKHKLDSPLEDIEVPHKKKKLKDNKNKNFKNKFSNKQGNESSDPMAKLSDERLKAYGLNPKKYRSFLKYKKY